MSSLQGTNTEFSSISNNFLYLTLTPDDLEYYTNIPQKTYKYLGVDEPDRLTLDQKLGYLSNVLEAQQTYKSLEQYKSPEPLTSIVDTIKALNLNNYLSNIINTISITNYDNELKAKRKGNVNGTTFFAYINGSENEINRWISQWRPDTWNTDHRILYQREILKHHTLPFVLLPQQIQGKRLQVATLLSDYISVYNKFDIETINGELYINYSNKNVLLDGEGYYPTSLQRIKILQAVACSDGIVYIIEKPIIPIIF